MQGFWSLRELGLGAGHHLFRYVIATLNAHYNLRFTL